MNGRSLPFDGTRAGCGPIFVPAFKNRKHLSSILACSFKCFCSFDLTSATTEATSPRLSITASKNRLLNSGDLKTMCTVRTTNVSRAAKRRLSTPFWFAISVSTTNVLTASSTYTRIPVTVLWTSSSLVRSLTEGQDVRRSLFREDLASK